MPRINNEIFYKNALKKYGISASGLNWHSTQSQKIRFEVIHSLLSKGLKSYSLIDAGCGFGDFYLYLQERQSLPKQYIGVDFLECMCNITQTATAQPTLQKDITKQELPNADYIVCSGALNILTKFESYQFIYNCFKHSNVAFVFNILYGDIQSQTYNYFNKDDIKNIIKELNVKNVKIEEGYMPNDITVGLYK
ncbi:class I SAM-dependent methyltransferase [Sulfurimonas sp.]